MVTSLAAGTDVVEHARRIASVHSALLWGAGVGLVIGLVALAQRYLVGTSAPLKVSSCSKAGYGCCNIEAAATTATGTQYYIDSKSGDDSNDGNSEEKAGRLKRR